MKSFFANSTYLDLLSLRLLSHIRSSWELTWDESSESYLVEDDGFGALINELVEQLETAVPPRRYHDNEDRLTEYVRDGLKWPVKKVGNRWVGTDYESILTQGGFVDIDQNELLLAAAGRIQAARARGQRHFDDMEDSHQRMLATVIAIIIYHRDSGEPSTGVAG